MLLASSLMCLATWCRGGQCTGLQRAGGGQPCASAPGCQVRHGGGPQPHDLHGHHSGLPAQHPPLHTHIRPPGGERHPAGSANTGCPADWRWLERSAGWRHQGLWPPGNRSALSRIIWQVLVCDICIIMLDSGMLVQVPVLLHPHSTSTPLLCQGRMQMYSDGVDMLAWLQVLLSMW